MWFHQSYIITTLPDLERRSILIATKTDTKGRVQLVSSVTTYWMGAQSFNCLNNNAQYSKPLDALALQVVAILIIDNFMMALV